MTLETVQAKDELRILIDAYAYLGDDKKIAEQMKLFTEDATYTVFMNGIVVAHTVGTEQLEKEFSAHASVVKTYFTFNGQHAVDIQDNKATGVSFSQLKMIRDNQGKDMITDYSVRYEDKYTRQNGKWLIEERIGHFLIIEARLLHHI